MKIKALLVVLIIFVSCTSNTIYKAPKDLIPKDTLALLITDMLKADAAKNTQNINLQKGINYMPLVYDKYGIDSVRLTRTSMYYLTKNEAFKEIFDQVDTLLQRDKRFYTALKKQRDSIVRDSLNTVMLKKQKEREEAKQ